jgi:hypothetical protein
MKTLSIALVILAFVCTAASQGAPPTDAKKAEMKKVEKLAGKWEGSGWIQQGRTRENFTGQELVQKKLDGLALLVEGKFINSEGKVAHETLAVLSATDKPDTFSFATYLANGIAGVEEFRVVGDHYEWGFTIPAGTVRYTIRADENRWSEIGEFSPDGKTWLKNFEMDLKRVK